MYVFLSTTLLVNYVSPMIAYGIGDEQEPPVVQQVNEDTNKTQETVGSSVEEETEVSATDEGVETASSEQENQVQESQAEVTESSVVEETEASVVEAEQEPAKALAEVLSAKAVQQGKYNIYSAGNSAGMLSVTDGSKSSGARVELNRQLYHSRSQFEAVPVDGTWFIIKNVNSGLVLDVQNGSKNNGAAVQQYSHNNTDAQKWQFVDAGNGYVYIQSKLGTVLDCTNGGTGFGTRIQTYALNHTNAQKWRLDTNTEPVLKNIATGTYQITGSGVNKVFSTNHLTKDNGAKVSLYSSVYNKANEFNLEKTSDNWYYIVNNYSQKALDIAAGSLANGVAIQQYAKNGTDAQKFRFIDAGGGYVYIQSKLGTVLDRAAGGTADGTKIQTYTLNQTAAQKWKLEAPKGPSTVAVQDGVRYLVSSNINTNLVLDVTGGGTANGANIQLWTENAVNQQKFVIRSADAGWYRLVNERSGKVLDVSNGSVANKANVQQYTWNNTDAQKFRFIDAGGGLCYIQSKLGTYLDVAAGQNKNGANVQMFSLNRTNAQKFRLDALNKTNYVRTTILSSTTARVTVFNSSVAASSMKFPTWSETNGQDDIKWLNGSKSYDGSWTVVVDSKEFKNGGKYTTHVYANGNKALGGTSYTLEKKVVQDDNAIRLSKPPHYYSQLDPSWSGITYGRYKFGPTGCVPTSMAMVLRGSYGINVSPVDTANRIYQYGGFNQQYYGSSATDLFRGIRSYGRSISNINSLNELNDYLAKGYPVIMFVNVGIGHAVVAHNYSNGKTNVYDPYGKQFYNGWVSTSTLWNTPSTDYNLDWTQGRPYFVIK
ncbi:hypothetical protein A5888_002611 [Enterococcus sp. 9E7_DIV0242]|uniref:Ricin B lectin domain-containing protein n=2 Tax=Candidatus Enterococcus clewellii TaxID=1834193 RepID=A0A242JV01_9ENTE|nr:hypothetical protein A5888_004210 [Enterococcus sp. 9E7_DIV0242]